MALVILVEGDVAHARQHVLRQPEDGQRLLAPDFQVDGGILGQVAVGLTQELRDGIQPLIAAFECEARLVGAHRGLQRRVFAARDVGQVGDEDVHRLAHRFEQISVAQRHLVAAVVALDVAARHRQRLAAYIDCFDGGVGIVNGNRQRNRAAARAHIGHAHALGPVGAARLDLAEDFIHQHFGLGAGDEDPLVDHQVEAVELLVPHQVGHRFVVDAAGNHFCEVVGLTRFQGDFTVGKEPGTLHAQHMRKDHLRVEKRRVVLRFLQPLSGRIERGTHGGIGSQFPDDGIQREGGTRGKRERKNCQGDLLVAILTCCAASVSAV